MASYRSEHLDLGDFLEPVVLVDDGLLQVVVRPCIQGVAAALEGPRPEGVAAYGSGVIHVPNVVNDAAGLRSSRPGHSTSRPSRT